MLHVAYILLRSVPSIHNVFSVFFLTIKAGCILSNAFSESIQMIMLFLFFILLMWHITFIGLCMLNHACIPGIHPTWLWWMILLTCCLIQFVGILLNMFALMFIRNIVLYFFSYYFLALLWYRNDAGLLKSVWKCAFLFICFGRVWEDWH